MPQRSGLTNAARMREHPKKRKEKEMSYLSDLLKEAYKENMTEEELSNALEKVLKKSADNSSDKDMQKLKAAFDKASADVSKYKKALEERMSEDEKAKAEREEYNKKLLEENESMRKEIAITKNKAQLIALGYPESLVDATAEAMYAGDTETVFKNQKAFLEVRDKTLRAELIKGTPTPPAGTGSTAITKEQFNSMSTYELMELYQKDPALYEQLAKG